MYNYRIFIIENLKHYYQTYQCILGKEHIQYMNHFLDNIPQHFDESDICWNCVSKTDGHIRSLQTLPREIQLLKKKSDQRKRATFLYRVQLKIARRDLYYYFSAEYQYWEECPDSRPYYIQKKIDKMTAMYQKNETQAHIKRTAIIILYSKLPKDVVDHIIKPYLNL